MSTDAPSLMDSRVDTRTIVFLDLLRGTAALLVVYDHLAAAWPDQTERSWIVTRQIRRYVSEPLGIIQDFGFLGVAIFFLVSGFIITHVAQRESRFQFAVKRILRIYPPLIASIIVIAGVTAIQGRDLYDIGDYLRAFTLVNYFQEPQIVINGVAWTLVVEMLFYSAVFLAMPLIKGHPQIGNLTILAVVAAVIWQARAFGSTFFLFAASVAYLPYLLLGQLVYLRWVRRITVIEYAVLTLGTYLVAVFGIRRIHTAFLPADNSYMISVGFAFVIFIGALAFEERIRMPRFLAFTSDVSYSLYLLHGVIGYLVLDELVGRIPFTAALFVAVSSGLAVAWLSHRVVEQPSQRLARQLIASAEARRSRRPETAAETR